MIDSLTKVQDLERELNTKLDLTEREKQMFEAIRYLLDESGGFVTCGMCVHERRE